MSWALSIKSENYIGGMERVEFEQIQEMFDIRPDKPKESLRIRDFRIRPKSYPCVAVYVLEKGFDRFSGTSEWVVGFVYMGDFHAKISPSR